MIVSRHGGCGECAKNGTCSILLSRLIAEVAITGCSEIEREGGGKG